MYTSLKGKITSSFKSSNTRCIFSNIKIRIVSNTAKEELHKLLFSNELIGSTNNHEVVSSDLMVHISMYHRYV